MATGSRSRTASRRRARGAGVGVSISVLFSMHYPASNGRPWARPRQAPAPLRLLPAPRGRGRQPPARARRCAQPVPVGGVRRHDRATGGGRRRGLGEVGLPARGGQGGGGGGGGGGGCPA